MFLRNCWYVAAWDYEVTHELFSRKILGESILFYRTPERKVIALADRCCHRRAPLSAGRLEGDCVRCLYHGMKFGPDGQCVEIPGQSSIPRKARVHAYPIEERHRWIWIWMGEPEKADPKLIPDTPWIDAPEWKGTPPGYLHYQANHQLLNDNLLDFSHLAYVHLGTLGGSESYAQLKPEIEVLERGLRISRWLYDFAPPPFVAKLLPPGNVDRWNDYDYLVPGILIMNSGFAAAGSGAKEGKREGAIEFRSCQAVTPETESTSHYFFSQPRNFDNHDPITDHLLDRALKAAFQEDLEIIEAQQQRWEENDTDEMILIAADAALVQFRRIVERLKEEERKSPATPG